MSSKYLIKSNELRIEPTDETKLYDADWTITYKRKGESVQIGRVSFAGTKENGTIPIEIELIEEYRHRGLGTKALKMMTEWAFFHRHVYEIKAVVPTENDRYIRALERSGFVYRGVENGIETYSIEKQRTGWTGLYLAIGIMVGYVIGFLFNNMRVGLVSGVLLGAAIGGKMDIDSNKERERITNKRLMKKSKK